MSGLDEMRDAVIRLTADVQRLKDDTHLIIEKLDELHTARTQIALLEERQGKVEKIVYGAIGIVLLAVGTAITALVVGRDKAGR